MDKVNYQIEMKQKELKGLKDKYEDEYDEADRALKRKNSIEDDVQEDFEGNKEDKKEGTHDESGEQEQSKEVIRENRKTTDDMENQFEFSGINYNEGNNYQDESINLEYIGSMPIQTSSL